MVGWGAIVSGAVVAVALEVLLMELGLAVATSVGDRLPGNGFGLWLVVVQTVCVAIGAFLTARLAHAERQGNAIAAGFMMWALIMVVGNLTAARALGPVGAWAAFVGAVLSLMAAVAGAVFAVGHRGGIAHGEIGTPHDEETFEAPTRPVAPVH